MSTVAPVAGALRAWVLRLVPALVSVAAVVAVWEVAARAGWLPISVAAPSEIRAELASSGDTLTYHLGPTLGSAIKGYVAATVVAFALGAVVAVRPRLAGPVYRTAVVVSSIPLIALTPVLVLWLDRGDTVRITIAALAGFFPILVGFVQGFSIADPGRDELFVVIAARGWQRFAHLTLPASLPYVFAGLKVAAASSVLGAIIAEWTGGGGTRGLGQMMVNALFGFDVPQTWLTITTAALLSVAAYVLVSAAERIVVRWDHGTVEAGL